MMLKSKVDYQIPIGPSTTGFGEVTKTSDNEWTKQKKKPSYCRKRMDTILRCSRIHNTEWSDHRYAQVILYGTRGCGRIAGTINSTSAHRRGWIARTITHKSTTVQANRQGKNPSMRTWVRADRKGDQFKIKDKHQLCVEETHRVTNSQVS